MQPLVDITLFAELGEPKSFMGVVCLLASIRVYSHEKQRGLAQTESLKTA